MIDKANFYKLPKEEQNKELKDLWAGSSKDVGQFAKNLAEEIKNEDTPFVLGVDGGYGTGKTYFSTRFAEYIKIKHKLYAIYCSVWENDYLENPFIAISKEIIKNINNATIKNKVKNTSKKLIDSIVNVISSLNISASIGTSFCLPKQKNSSNEFSAKIEVDTTPKDICRAMVSSWIEEKDEIQQFKINLANFIKQIDGKKLVLIIDELDRCRPDFAVKTLEILKHFFDIEGLYVILMINRNRLEKHINAFYNIQDSGEEKENYLIKFINRYENIPNLNYEVIVDDFLKVERLKEAIDKGNITEDETKFNSFTELKISTIEACHSKGKTYRQSQSLINKIIKFCNIYKEPIRCKFLPRSLYCEDFNGILDDKKYKLLNHITRYTRNHGASIDWQIIDSEYRALKSKDQWGTERFIYGLTKDEYDAITLEYNELKSLGSDKYDKERSEDYLRIAKSFNKLYENY